MKNLTFSVFLILGVTATAFGQWKWPEKAKNLKVLPVNTTAKELQKTMFGFTRGLGVRCTFCHVGEEGKPLESYDLVSDEKPTKSATRWMMKLVQLINASEPLTEVRKDRPKPIAVACVTCHHGSNKPVLIEELLVETVLGKGSGEGIKQYRDLHEKFYGGFVYDFRENMLIRVVDQLDSAHTKDAIEMLKLNLEMYPKSGISYFYLGARYEILGDKSDAMENYRKNLEINPDNEQAKNKLEKLSKQK